MDLERFLKIYAKYLRHRDERPVILLLGSNTLREIISFMTMHDFMEFCLVCKKFLKFATDPWVKIKIKLDKQLNVEDSYGLEPLIEQKTLDGLKQHQLPAVNIEWKPYKVLFFHYVLYKNRRFVLLHHQSTFEVKEMPSFSQDLSSVFSRDFEEPIIMARGYKNRVFLMLKTKLVTFTMNAVAMLNDEGAQIEGFQEIALPEKRPREIQVFNHGRNIILAYARAVYILDFRLNVVAKHSNENMDIHIHVPSLDGKGYILYFGCQIDIRKLGFVDCVTVISHRGNVVHLATDRIDGENKIIYTNDMDELFINNKHIENIRCTSQIIVIKQLLLFEQDFHCGNLVSYDLHEHRIVGSISVSKNWKQHLIGITGYKFLTLEDFTIIFQSLLDNSCHFLQVPFKEIFECKLINPFLFVSGKFITYHGVIILDLSRTINSALFAALVNPPETEVEEKKVQSEPQAVPQNPNPIKAPKPISHLPAPKHSKKEKKSPRYLREYFEESKLA
jgi:hypothetical protein